MVIIIIVRTNLDFVSYSYFLNLYSKYIRLMENQISYQICDPISVLYFEDLFLEWLDTFPIYGTALSTKISSSNSSPFVKYQWECIMIYAWMYPHI